MRASAFMTALVLAAGMRIAFAAEADVSPKQTVVLELQKAVRTNDKTWLADHAHYPVNYFGKTKFVIRNKAAFKKRLPLLIGDELRTAVLSQDPSDVFENWQGQMVGNGNYNIWIRDFGDGDIQQWRIVTINNGPS
jgi:hypothetical protein